MKQIYSMGKGKYVHMDSYPETTESKVWTVGIVLLSLLIATITGMALLGVEPGGVEPEIIPMENTSDV